METTQLREQSKQIPETPEELVFALKLSGSTPLDWLIDQQDAECQRRLQEEPISLTTIEHIVDRNSWNRVRADF